MTDDALTVALHRLDGGTKIDHAIRINAGDPAWLVDWASDSVSRGNIRLVVIHASRLAGFLASAGEIDQPFGAPPAEWYAIHNVGGRWDYRLTPLPLGIGSGDGDYEVMTRKADITCYYDVRGLLDAQITAGEHYHWGPGDGAHGSRQPGDITLRRIVPHG